MAFQKDFGPATFRESGQIPVCLDTHLPGPGGRREELELPTGQETLTALRTGERGGEGVWEMAGSWEEGRKWKFL